MFHNGCIPTYLLVQKELNRFGSTSFSTSSCNNQKEDDKLDSVYYDFIDLFYAQVFKPIKISSYILEV